MLQKTAEMMRALGILQIRHIAVDILCFRKNSNTFFLLLLAIVRVKSLSEEGIYIIWVLLQQTSTAAFIHWLSKTFQCAHCNADANQRIKGIQQVDKEGLMPTSVPLATIIGIKHIVCLFFRLSWHLTNKMAVLVATGTQHKRCTESNIIKRFYGLRCISYQMIDTPWCLTKNK